MFSLLLTSALIVLMYVLSNVLSDRAHPVQGVEACLCSLNEPSTGLFSTHDGRHVKMLRPLTHPQAGPQCRDSNCWLNDPPDIKTVIVPLGHCGDSASRTMHAAQHQSDQRSCLPSPYLFIV
ncbi:hypothetical protein RRG08_033474 [Elysia crispata]|uniref:Secreted protein n=1 Tax=Elysia crispata TaxID=231223 RepID=A0AAE1ATZ0_9GAST|nr:hypothetical protein RRG08_033474 [Elysia crispata]